MADKEEKEKVVQTGSQPVDNSGTSKNNAKDTEQGTEKQGSEEQASGSQTEASSQSEGSQQKATEGGEGKEAGEQKTGERSTEDLLKTLEKSQQEITQRLDSMTKPSEEGQKEQQPDYDAQLNELDRMLKEGELNVDDYSARVRSIQEQKFANQSSEIVDQKLKEQQMEQATDQYLQQNPDFQQYYNSQEMQQVMKQNPLLDEVGAYEYLKRQEAEQQIADLNQRLEQLQQERDNAVKNGAEVTDMPGKDSGAALQHGEVETNKNLSPEEGMKAALRRVRQATQ